jgi:hypothetical protein
MLLMAGVSAMWMNPIEESGCDWQLRQKGWS